jgi:hypothetical protein
MEPMSGGGKRLTTSQKVFARWHRAESLSNEICDLIADIERLTKSTKKRAEKQGLRQALDLFNSAHATLTSAQNALDRVMEMEA